MTSYISKVAVYVAGVTLGSVTSYISKVAVYVAGVTLGSVTSYISKVAVYVAGVTLGSVTSYISAEWHAAVSETICGGIRDYLWQHQRLSTAQRKTISGKHN